MNMSIGLWRVLLLMTYSSGNSIHKLTVEKCSLSIDIYRAVSKQITIQYEVAVKFDGE